jgi:hypothetical protein
MPDGSPARNQRQEPRGELHADRLAVLDPEFLAIA